MTDLTQLVTNSQRIAPTRTESVLKVRFVQYGRHRRLTLEVKSGKDYERHNALSKVLSTPNYGIRRAIVLCNDNLHVKGNVEYLPVYMTMFLVKQDELENPIYKVNLEF